MQIHQTFASKGVIIFYKAVSEGYIDEWRRLARRADIWFSDVLDDVVEDEGRLQSVVPDQDARDMTSSLKRFYKTFFPDAQANDWRFLKTLAGSEDQPVRRDFPSMERGEDLMNYGALPGTVMVALEDDTYLYAYGWNRQAAHRSERKLIELNKGDNLLLRGDFIYAPVGYQMNKVCVQAYLDSLVFERHENHMPHLVPTIDDTVGVNDPFWFVWNCGHKANSPAALRRHVNRHHGIRFKQVSRHQEP
jgi:hypothetical protein